MKKRNIQQEISQRLNFIRKIVSETKAGRIFSVTAEIKIALRSVFFVKWPASRKEIIVKIKKDTKVLARHFHIETKIAYLIQVE